MLLQFFLNVPSVMLGLLGMIGIERDLVRRDRIVRARLGAIFHGVSVVEGRARIRAGGGSAWADTSRRLIDSIPGESGRVHSGHPQADLVQLVEVVDEALEIDVLIGVVIEDEFLPVPRRSKCKYAMAFGADVRDGPFLPLEFGL